MGAVEFMVEKMVVQWRSDEWWLKFGGLLVGLYRATDIIMEKFFIHKPDDLTLSPNSQEKLVRDNPPAYLTKQPFVLGSLEVCPGGKINLPFESQTISDNDVVHVNGKVDPKWDFDVITLELVFSDSDQIEKRLEKLKKGKAKDSQSKLEEDAEKSAMERIRHALMDGKPARSVTLTDFEKDAVNHLCLLKKPVIYVENVAESDLADSEINP
ncbi:GTP-binding family protein [Populus alba x Populus x berolinensis]|nr:GTP-binding family protein [Populus alba x Populus x berolinensis]